ncbi:MAG: CDP-6-deoxy-delta-3,4-glucoseen reductase [Gammaproteobacteria bacterium]
MGPEQHVRIKPSGKIITVRPGESILDAALRAGLNLPHSCRGGSCMACRARVLEGEVGYPTGRPLGLVTEDEERGFALLCRAVPQGDVTIETQEIVSTADIHIRRLPCRVQEMRRLAHDVMALELKLPTVEPFHFLPGQYVDLLLADGRRRSFSMANPPDERNLLEIHVRRVSGGEFTDRVFTTLQRKDLLRLEGPLGGFFWREAGGSEAVLIAGGTGFAPLKAMLRQAFDSGDERLMHLYWGARARRDLYELELIEAWAAQHPRLRFTPVLSEPAASDAWTGRTGLVHRAVLEDYPSLAACDVYMSGPPDMIEAGRREFPARGLDPARLFFDSFDFAPDVLARIRGHS